MPIANQVPTTPPIANPMGTLLLTPATPARPLTPFPVVPAGVTAVHADVRIVEAPPQFRPWLTPLVVGLSAIGAAIGSGLLAWSFL
jgi:hypothetical protein